MSETVDSVASGSVVGSELSSIRKKKGKQRAIESDPEDIPTTNVNDWYKLTPDEEENQILSDNESDMSFYHKVPSRRGAKSPEYADYTPSEKGDADEPLVYDKDPDFDYNLLLPSWAADFPCRTFIENGMTVFVLAHRTSKELPIVRIMYPIHYAVFLQARGLGQRVVEENQEEDCAAALLEDYEVTVDYIHAAYYIEHESGTYYHMGYLLTQGRNLIEECFRRFHREYCDHWIHSMQYTNHLGLFIADAPQDAEPDPAQLTKLIEKNNRRNRKFDDYQSSIDDKSQVSAGELDDRMQEDDSQNMQVGYASDF